MAWARIDDSILDHPKILMAGEEAADLFIRSIIWCNKHLTDGHLPHEACTNLTRKRSYRKQIAALVRVGLWEEVEGGYRIRGFLEHNDSAEEVKRKRRDAAERQAKSRAARTAQAATGHANVTRDSDVTSPSVTVPTPLLSSPIGDLTPPKPPTASPQGVPLGDVPQAKPARERKTRTLTPEVEKIRARISVETGAAPHPPSAFDKLIRGIESGALSVEDADTMVGYLASGAADGYWRKRGIPPAFVFAPRHVSEILPLAKGWRAGTLRTQSKPSAPNPYRLVTD